MIAIDWIGALGDSPDALRRPVVLPAGRAASEARVVARDDGGIVACFGDEAGTSGPPVVCQTAATGTRFGAARVVARGPAKEALQLEALSPRAGGRVVVAYSRRVGTRRRRHLWRVGEPGGRFGPVHVLAETDDEATVTLGNGPDGAVLAGVSMPGAYSYSPRTPVLRRLGPEDDDFGGPLDFTRDKVASGIAILGSPHGLALLYDVYNDQNASTFTSERVAVQRPDGTFAPPVDVPGPARGFVSGLVVFEPDGTPTVVSEATRDSSTDCSDTNFGRVGAGPFSGPLTTLSTPGQIAWFSDAAVLADGTLLVVWEDGMNGDGDSRLEYAVRPPGGAFGAGRPLPVPAARGFTLADGGGQALLAWVTGELPDGPSRLVVSTWRTAPPYAPLASRPAHPATGCA